MVRSLAAPLLAVLLCAVLAAPAAAGPMTPYDRQAFLAAREAGRPVVVFVHAAWCVTCRRQQPVLEKLARDPAFADVVVFVVNYDRDKDALRELGIADRSTLVAYRGADERRRASFVTDEAQIRALFESVR
ncbi:MAG TPA: thioredoxin family protein [Candidatus Tectomicrobia bacterium]|nr:thioredoxin family protein [Candidatus Tectomicrobia bacterium]